MPAERAQEDVQVEIDRPPTDYERWLRSHDKDFRISPAPQYHPPSGGDKDPTFQPEPLKFQKYSSGQEATEPTSEEPYGSIFPKLEHPDESLLPSNLPRPMLPTDRRFWSPKEIAYVSILFLFLFVAISLALRRIKQQHNRRRVGLQRSERRWHADSNIKDKRLA